MNTYQDTIRIRKAKPIIAAVNGKFIKRKTPYEYKITV